MNALIKRFQLILCTSAIAFTFVGCGNSSYTVSSTAASSRPQPAASSTASSQSQSTALSVASTDAVSSGETSSDLSSGEGNGAYNPLTGEASDQIGNSSGNLANEGLACASGDWIYYVSYSSKTDGKLCKIRKDNTGQTVLCNDNARYINVAGDWIYYSVAYKENDFDFSKIYRIHTDGTGKQMLVSQASRTSYIHVAGSYLYYEKASLNSAGLPDYNLTNVHRIGLDGSQDMEYSLFGNNNFEIKGNSIYELANFFERVDLDNPTKEISGQANNYSSGKMIYTSKYIYACPADHGNIGKTDYSQNRYDCLFSFVDESTLEKPFNINNVDYFNLSSESIFFFIEGGRITIENSENHKETVLKGAAIANPNIIDNWIYCTKDNCSYRFSIDNIFDNNVQITLERV